MTAGVCLPVTKKVMSRLKGKFLEMLIMNRYLHFSDVPDSGGTLTLDLPKIKSKGAFIIKQTTVM